ncbi:MAG: substrate-binding domain-containing protein [Tannerella sp.]|jgi:phosphate transport system substrate-binding protein|nr:substrate-binding domain-containing protein [Tannerella sp.]
MKILRKWMLSVVCCCASAAYAQQAMEGYTFDNYPRVDGSTSTLPLNRIIACKLLGLSYNWELSISGVYGVYVPFPSNPDGWERSRRFQELTQSSQTHYSFINLIDNKADVIITARKMSAGERAYAEEAGVSLIETPIAWDAFIMLAHAQNPVGSLTKKQIQDIYTGQVTNWSKVGGKDRKINPYSRNYDSGSQELMETFVMGELEMPEWPYDYDVIRAEVTYMYQAYELLGGDPDGICYSVHYYRERIMNEGMKNLVKSLAIEGIPPNEQTIADGTYPFRAEVYAVIRSDQDRESRAYKLYEWLRTEEGKAVITESGYLPYNGQADHSLPVAYPEIRLYPNPAADGFYVSGLTRMASCALFDLSGRKVLSLPVADGGYVRMTSLPTGPYIVTLSDGKKTVRHKLMKR